MNRKPYTAEEDQYLRDNYLEKSGKVMAKSMGRGVSSVYSRLHTLNLYKQGAQARRWTEEEDQFLMENIGTMTHKEIAERLGRLLGGVKSRSLKIGATKSRDQISAISKRLDNKGHFKKGHDPGNTLFPGAITLRLPHKNRRGGVPYYWIITGKKEYTMLHVYMWELINGPVKEGHIIVFKDGNSMNVLFNNLEEITKKENMIRNSAITNLPDKYIAHLLAGKTNKEMKGEYMNHPDLLEAKRQTILLDREIKTHENVND